MCKLVCALFMFSPEIYYVKVLGLFKRNICNSDCDLTGLRENCVTGEHKYNEFIDYFVQLNI